MIDVAPRAAEIPLVNELVTRARENLALGGMAAEFSRLRGAVAVVVVDSGTAFTLRFDLGRLGVHGGLVGVPDVTIRGTRSGILQLTEAPELASAALTSAPCRGRLRALLGKLRRRELKVYGWMWHARLIMRVLRLFAAQAGAGCRETS